MNGEGCVSILKGLLGFQKRMRLAETFGENGKLCTDRAVCRERAKADLYMEALEEAIWCVEIVHGMKKESYEAWKAEWLKNHETVEEAISWAREHIGTRYAERLERFIREMEGTAKGHGR